MSISVKCQECGKGLKAPDELAGKKAKCPQCGTVVPIPMSVVDAEVIDDEPADDEAEEPATRTEKRRPCPMCGEMILASAAKCRFCDEVFDSRVKRSGRSRGGTADYAGFGARFVAAFVDGIIVILIGGAIGAVIGVILGAAVGPNVAKITPILERIGNLIGLLVGWLYSALQESSEKQATIGKKMMGIMVTDLNGDRISFGRASGRHFAKILSGCLLMIGYIMAAFTEKKQALHDMIAGTLVVRS